MAGDEQHPKDAADPAAGSASAAGREAARMASTEVGAPDGFRVEDSFEYGRERDAIEAALFGSALPQLKIGRFAILDRIGQGGMGTVYAAYDDQLDRKVAVKILRQRSAAKGSSQATRFMREAQAMARLRHQNTVTVHEVGEHEDGVFIAMEFVRGQSLDRWLRAGDEVRRWREVVEVFRQAGRGLAAAHEAGIVHRDFKPHNAILGEDGVVQVLDFGLARAATAPDAGAGEGASESAIREVLGAFEPGSGSGSGSGSAALSNKLTVTGSILGTPAYMAPEQWRGEVVDARGDQFSFCVALYEGLYGRLPFAGDNPAELLDNVLAGRVREPPSTARVPAWVGRAVLRGLAVDPGQRHASMAALVELLGQDPTRRRRWWLGGAALTLLVGGASVGLTLALSPDASEPAREPCSGVADALAETFDAARLAEAEAAVLGTKLPYAGDTWARVEPRLRDYAGEWIERSQASCRAHHDGRLSTTLFDRATACLAEGRDSLDALLEVLEGADAGAVEGAIDAVAKLPRLSACVDEARLSAALPEPIDPKARATMARERERVARARVLYTTGRHAEAQTLIAAALEQAEALSEAGETVLLAEVELARGTLAQESWSADEADAGLSRALELALAVGHTEVATEAAARRLHVRGTMQFRLDEALVDASYGGALLERSGGQTPLAWLYLNNAGTLLDTRGSDDEARALYGRALAAVADEGDSIEAVFTRSNLAQLEAEHHRFDEAIASQRQALAEVERLYGSEHPMRATLLYILANTLSNAGSVDEATRVVGEALRVEEAVRGEDNPVLNPELTLSAKLANRRRRYAEAEAFGRRALTNEATKNFFSVGLRHAHGDALIGLGRVDEGLASHREAVEIARQVFADQVSRQAWANQGLAVALLEASEQVSGAGDSSALVDEARARAREALELREANPESSAVELAAALACLARVELARGDREAAASLLARGRETLSGAVPDSSPLFAQLWLMTAELAELEGDGPAARRAYGDAVVTLRARRDEDDPDLARARVGLARARAAVEGGSAGAEEAHVALAVYEALGPAYAEEGAELRRWMGEKNFDRRDPSAQRPD